jgi:hypothetical protein
LQFNIYFYICFFPSNPNKPIVYPYRYLLLLLFFNLNVFSQQLFCSIGKNSTTYNYRNTNGETLNGLERGSGLFLEGGVLYNFDSEQIFFYQGSLTLNQYNASANVSSRQYSWKTNYLGLQNVVGIRLFKTRTSFSANVKLGVNISHIISGKQTSDGVPYDLKKEPEFKGIFIAPLGGVSLNYEISDYVDLVGGYNFSIPYSMSSAPEKLSFTNQQILVGFIFKPK